jgi:hypothetical protein
LPRGNITSPVHLTGAEAALVLRSRISGHNIASELALLFVRVQTSDFNYDHYRPLVRLLIQKASDSEIWNTVLDLITTLSSDTPPTTIPATSESTLITHSFDNLCGYCSKIPLDPGLTTLRKPDYTGPKSWNLGSFGQLRERNCPFCVLVTSICTNAAASWHTKSQPEEHEEIEIQLLGGGFHAGKHSQIGTLICTVTTENTMSIIGARDHLDEDIDFKEARRWMETCMKKHDYADCSKREPRTLNLKSTVSDLST